VYRNSAHMYTSENGISGSPEPAVDHGQKLVASRGAKIG
jgi:hypothetical protein